MNLQAYRIQRITMAAEKAGVAAVVASLPANILYLSGFRGIGQEVLCRSQAFVLYDVKKARRLYIMGTADIPSILEHDEAAEIFATGGFFFDYTQGNAFSDKVKAVRDARYGSMEEALAAAIATVDGDVALDESRVNFDSFRKIASLTGGKTLVSGSGVFMEARKLKHPDEVTGLRRSVNVAEKALAASLADFAPGKTTELDIERKYLSSLAENGALPLFFVATAARRAAFSDTTNTGLVINQGDMIRFDFGCVLDGYCSDIARTAAVGTPSDKLFTYFEAMRIGTETAIAALKPGVTAGEIFSIAVETTRAKGVPHYKRHHCGHGIGLETYDYPSIVADSKVEIEEGMTLCIETPYYELGWGGVQAEDTVAVHKDGPEYLDASGRGLIRLG